MRAESEQLLALAEAVADGRPVNWDVAESTSVGPATRELLKELRLLAGVADLHRSTDGDSKATAAEDLSGTTWGHFELRERIGGGTFGTVYLAWDPRIERDVALKLIPCDVDEGPASVTVDEGRMLAQIRNPHVITVYGADRIGQYTGIWMEVIRGRTFEEYLRTDGPLGGAEAALLGIDLCGALAAVHNRGLVHRDVKAQNVMREQGGRTVLMDFGAGQESASGSSGVAGTPLYMAPELFSGRPASPQSDLYSLGVLLFRLTTGQYPVHGATLRDVQDAHATGTRRRLRDLRPDLAPSCIAAIERALSTEPADRFQTAGAMADVLASGVMPPSRAVRRSLWVASLIAGVVLAGWLSGARLPGATNRSIRSIGVLPLTNLTGDAAQGYFSSGLTNVLLADLGSLRALRIVALAQPPAPSDESSRNRLVAAGIDGVLDGSVQRSEGRIRIAIRLAQTGSGEVIWGRTYEGALAEAFTLQGRIAADLTRELDVPGSPGRGDDARRPVMIGSEAQDAYVHGRYLLDRFGRANLRQARIEFEKAIRLEPTFAPAHAALAMTYLNLGNVGELRPVDVAPLARTEASTAFNLDPSLAEASLAMADVQFRLDWDWSEADAAYRRAIELNPSYIQARGQYARFLSATGRVDEALREARAAYQIDPLSAEIHGVVGMMLYYSRKYDKAIAHFLSRADSAAGRAHTGLGRAYAGARRFPEALTELRSAYEDSAHDPSLYAEIGRTLADAGDVARARAILRELEDRQRTEPLYIAPQDLAYIHVALGQADEALRLLHEAADEHASRLLWLLVDPRVDPLRKDPRFNALLNKVGLNPANRGVH